MIPTLEAMRDAMLISSTDRHFAKEMGRLGEEVRPLALAAIALASQETALGHTCLDLSRLSQAAVWGDLSKDFAIPETPTWREVLASSPLVAPPPRGPDAQHPADEAFDDARPMILDAAGRLYLRRYWVFQQQLADQLRKRAATQVADVDLVQLASGLHRFFGPSRSPSKDPPKPDVPQYSFAFDPVQGDDGQRHAAELAVKRNFSVISGGPGTGKTATAGKILALVVEQAVARAEQGEVCFPRIALVAPTGKAAATLASSINSAVSTLACQSEVKKAIPTVAQTIHRCLGVRGGALPGFRHHAGNPLPIDLLLVDEASMVDLALMTRLLSAVPREARVILLGDEHQLASVETGAVLGDICAVGLLEESPASRAKTSSPGVGKGKEANSRESAEDSIRDCIARLTYSYRYPPESGIGALARAINQGDAEAALEILDSSSHPEVMRVDFDSEGQGVAQLHRDVVRGFGSYLALEDFERMLAGFAGFRVLSPLRRGPGGVLELNRSIESILRRETLIGESSAHYPGRPILINTNDYTQRLFNGDVGIVLPEEDGVERVIFQTETGQTRRVACSRLPEHETAYAMTVHKSQGSEFDEVAIVLTQFAAQRATRELLYTAVTRARSKVSLYGSRDAIAQTIGRKVERASGLGDALRFPA